MVAVLLVTVAKRKRMFPAVELVVSVASIRNGTSTPTPVANVDPSVLIAVINEFIIAVEPAAPPCCCCPFIVVPVGAPTSSFIPVDEVAFEAVPLIIMVYVVFAAAENVRFVSVAVVFEVFASLVSAIAPPRSTGPLRFGRVYTRSAVFAVPSKVRT